MLVRKSIMIDNNLWNQLELIKTYRKQQDAQVSISKLISEGIGKLLAADKLDAFDIALKLYSTPMEATEEKELSELLNNMTDEDMETAEIIDLSKIEEPNKEELSDLIKWANS